MQITEQIIERISRRTFNSMFASALRQSNVVTSGAGSSVSWADNAGHATTADSATTAGTASAAPWAGITDKPATATRWPKWSEVTEKPNFATVATSGSYSDLSDKPYIPSVSAAVADSTLTVTIDGTSYSLTDTNTWRPVVNNLSSTDTDKSLSAAMGKDLYGYITTLQGYFDANGNAKSALKLTTVSKTAWGKTFWTAGGIPASIDGDMTSVGDISFSASGKKIGGFLYFDTANDRIGVGVDTPLSPLHVGGAARFAGDVVPADDYATTEYNLGTTSKRWGRVRAQYVELTGTAPACHVGSTTLTRISLHWASDSKRGLYDYTDAWVIGTDGTNTFLMKGNVGIGTTSPDTEKLKVNGSIYTTVGLFSEGYLDTLSDKRFKDVVDYDAIPSLDAIADAPAIHFKWNDREDDTIHVGSISQYWQKVMPEATHMRNGKLGMNYDVIATLNTIALAREVRELKAEIAKLKQQNHVG
jgi:hypothetical protein